MHIQTKSKSGKGKRLPLRERIQCVAVQFQDNAWCDEGMIEWWAKNCWKPKVKEDSLFVMDLHKAQKTYHIRNVGV